MIPLPWLVRGAALAAIVGGPKLARMMRGRGQGQTVYGLAESPFGGRQASKRREQVFAWAHQNSWRYDPLENQVPGLWYQPPFGMGTDRQAEDVLTGQFRGKHAVSFTYTWREDNGSTVGGMDLLGTMSTMSSPLRPVGRSLTSTSRRRPVGLASGTGTKRSVHVIAMDIPAWVPIVHFIPRNLADRIVWKREDEHVEVESASFNDHWRVRSRNVRFAHSLLHPRYIDRMLYPDAIGRNLRFEGKSVICWFNGPTKVENINPSLLLLSSMVDLIPEFIWQEYR